MVSSFHYRWWGQVFLNELFRRIHGLADHLKQILCYMHAWNHSSDQNSKTLRDAKKLKERWWVFSKWSKGLEKKCVSGCVFTIFCWRWSFGNLGIWTTIVERGGNFGTLWKLVGFFCQAFFVFFCIFFAFDDDVGTYFKEVVIGKKKFFVAWISSIALWIFVAIIVVVEHFRCCCYCDYFGNNEKEICRKNVNHQDVILSGV